ncbi:ribonuclease H-like domain-containing protein [Tanacetum coccineum]
MDLKWQLALLSMRTRRFFHKTGRKITIIGSDTVGYDKSKVECFKYHKMGHFARECRGVRNQDNRNRNQDSSRRTVNVEEISSKAMLAIDGVCFDWSYMADDEVPTNMALMVFSDSEFNKSEFNLATYKRGLALVEEQLVFYKKNKVIFYEQIAVLKRDISYKDSEISMLKSELEKLKLEKESNQLKIENFDKASKRLFSPPKFDLSNSGLEEFQQPEFEGYGPKNSKSVSEDISNEVRESPDASLVEELVSDDKGGAKERKITGNGYSLNLSIFTTAPLEATHADFFGDETEVDMSNITTTYPVPSTPNTRIHKDHSLDHVIGDVQSGVQTRRMIKTTNEQGAQKVNLSSKRSHAGLKTMPRRASAVQVTTGLDLGGFTTWKKSHWIEAIGCSLPFAHSMTCNIPDGCEECISVYGKSEEEDFYVCQPSRVFEIQIIHMTEFIVEKGHYMVLHQALALDRKSNNRRLSISLKILISWTMQESKTLVSNYSKSDIVGCASCCGQVLWIQNQMLDYGYNLMNTKIFIDNESTICIVKNPVFHSKTKHIEIRHHFIRDSNEKKLIQMIKIYTDQNVADLLTKAFDVGRFQYLIASIGMLNL